MKALLFFKAALIIAVLVFLLGCQKEPLSPDASSAENVLNSKTGTKKDKKNAIERPLKGRLISSSTFVPDVNGGWTPDAENILVPAYYPGKGEGNLSHLGKFDVFFNQHAVQIGSNTVGSGAPITMFTDLLGLEEYFSEEELAAVETANVSNVFFDRHGNAIWSRVKEGGYEYNFTSETHMELYAEAEIIGGTGRFEGAKGKFTLSGYSDLNLQTGTSKDVLKIEGKIIY